ncbi:MAG: hypothetical protein IJZ64_01065, partial [Ruminococcus sp.]|nr:hypothetical protein [Ruminococcus sp.]
VQRHQDNPLMAQLLRNYQQKHEGLYSDYVPDTEQKIKDFDDLDGLSLKICVLLENEKKIHADTLLETLGEDAMEVAGALTELCMRNIIKRLPGQYYEFL